jgi:uncharacterized protein
MVTFDKGNEEYENGNYGAAFEIFMTLAKMGDVNAQLSIACMYESGIGVQQNPEASVNWYQLAAEQGHPVAQNNLAVVLFDVNPKEAVQWLFIAAENNVPFAQSMLGDIYSGGCILPSDMRDNMRSTGEAIKWYKKAGDGGFVCAYHELGEIFSQGRGVEKNEHQALEYFLIAANHGYKPSQETLARAYTDELLGLPKDIKLAQYWFDQAQKSGVE